MSIHDQINQLLKGKVLDVGFAADPLKISSPALELYGIDIQNVIKPINYREAKVGINLFIESIPYGDNFFNTVFVGETIEHFPNPIRFLCECRRVLRDDGLLILTTPNPYYYIHFLDNLFPKKFNAHNFQHVNNFTRLTMRSVLEHSGFILNKEIGTLFFIPFIRKKITLAKTPMLTDSVIYVCQKNMNFKGHFIDLDRPYKSKGSKEFRIEADIF